jgi:hypothetical protein
MSYCVQYEAYINDNNETNKVTKHDNLCFMQTHQVLCVKMWHEI